MLIEGPPGTPGPAVSIFLNKKRSNMNSCQNFLNWHPGCLLTLFCLFRVFQDPQAYKDPQALLEILVTGWVYHLCPQAQFFMWIYSEFWIQLCSFWLHSFRKWMSGQLDRHSKLVKLFCYFSFIHLLVDLKNNDLCQCFICERKGVWGNAGIEIL